MRCWGYEVSIAKNLAKHLGGKWTHVPFYGRWECDDGERAVQWRSVLGGFSGDEHVGSEAWLYAKGEAPRRAERFMGSKPALCLVPSSKATTKPEATE